MELLRRRFAKRFDTSLIEPDASDENVVQFIERCKRYSGYLAAVAFNPHQIPLAAKRLRNSGIEVCGVVAYPLGCLPTELKVAQAQDALESGAKQIDLCMDVGVLKSGRYDLVARDVEAVVKAVKDGISNISVIPNTAFLTRDQKVVVCEIVKVAGASMLKTNTGFGLVTTLEDVGLIKKEVGDSLQIMASGGIRDIGQAMAMFEAGADKVATSTPFQIFEGIERIQGFRCR